MKDVQNISQAFANISLPEFFEVVSRIISLKFLVSCKLKDACLLPCTRGMRHKFGKLSRKHDGRFELI
jgi:hypothetical protein